MNAVKNSLISLFVAISFIAPAGIALALDNPTTGPETGVTATSATLNGINGGSVADVGKEAFWFGSTATSGPFIADTEPTVANQLPAGWAGVFATSQDPAASGNFSYSLSALTPNTTYYYIAWSRVGGLWFPSAVKIFTTAPLPNVTTQAATAITAFDATFNGITGPNATSQESFWVSTSTIVTSTSNIPAGVWSTPVLPGVAANTNFSDPLSLVTTNGIITGGALSNMPAITPGTTYFYVAWANVGGLWFPGLVQSFVTLKLNQTITFGGLSGQTYGAADFPVSATSDSSLPVTFSGSGACTVTGSTVHITKAGTCTVTASQSGSSVYNAATSVPQSFTVAPLAITVTAVANSRVYNGLTSAAALPTIVPALITGDTAVTSETYDTKNVGTGKVLTPSIVITDGNGGANYAVTYATSSAGTITTATLNVTPVGVNKVYDATTNAPISFTDNRAAGDNLTIVGTGAFANKFVGTGKVVIILTVNKSGPDAANYTMAVSGSPLVLADITPLNLTPTLTASSKVYDHTTTASTTCAVTPLLSDAVSCVVGSATFDTKDVGASKTVTGSGITLSGADAANYTVTPTTTATAAIIPAPLTVVFTASNKVYDALLGATILTSSLTGVIPTDVVTVSGGTASFATKTVGIAKPVTASGFTLGGANAGDYAITVVTPTTANITQRPLNVTATGINKVYDGTIVASVTFTSNKIITDTVNISGTATFDTKHVGTGKTVSVTGISISGFDVSNYSLVNTTTSTTAAITTRAVTVTAGSNTKVYDTTTTAATLPTITTGTLATGDTAVMSETYDTKNVGTGKTLTPAITITDGNGGNDYAVTLANNTSGVITTAPVTVAFTANNKVYNGTTAATIATWTVSGAISPEVVTASGGTAVFNDKNVGTAKPVTATGFTLSSTNYAVTTVTPTTANITKATLTATVAPFSKVYDGTTAATNIPLVLSGVITPDVVTATSTGTFPSKHVGSPLTVTITSATLGGADAGNYMLPVFPLSDAGSSITTRALTVTALTNTKVYDGTTIAAAPPTITSGSLATGDTVALSEKYASQNVGTGKTILPIVSITDGNPTPGANYALTLTNATTGVITITSANASQTTVVHAADLDAGPTLTAVTNNSGKWFMYNDTTDTIDNTLGSFVTGPATAPAGLGSVEFALAASPLDRKNIATYKFSGTRLSDIMGLTFGTYSHSGVAGANEDPYLNFNIDFTGTSGSFQRRLVYVPSVNSAVTQDAWQQWDAVSGGNAKWSYSGAVWPTTVVGPDAGVIGQAGTIARTWNAVLEDYPQARMLPVGGWLGVRVGEPGPTNYTADVDNVVVTLFSTSTSNTTQTTYDFEPTPVVVPPVIVTPPSGGGGGGGNGPISGSFGGSGGGAGSGSVLGASTTTVPTTNTTTPPGTSSTFKFLKNMRSGSHLSPDVSELQKVLIAQVFLKIPAPTGTFGPKTTAAVKLYQSAHSITPSGNVFLLTRNALNK